MDNEPSSPDRSRAADDARRARVISRTPPSSERRQRQRDAMAKKWERYKELRKKSIDTEIVWTRQILTLAAGALALLAGLGPDVPAEGYARYFLATTWVCLGFGIVAGAAATYLAAHLAGQEAEDALLEAVLRTDTPPSPRKVFEWTNRLLWLCMPLMVVSLLAAVICLTAYAALTTLMVSGDAAIQMVPSAVD